MGDVIARLSVADHALAALAHPAHRAPGLARRPGDQRLFGVDHMFHAKSTAEGRRENAHSLLLGAENIGDDGAGIKRMLGVGVQRVAPTGFIENTERAASLDRIDDQAVIY